MSEGPKVLVVEDEAMLRDAYQLVLGQSGFDIDTARDGVEALERIDSFKPDVVLLDLLMPRMDGMRTLEELSLGVDSKMKVIVYSNLFDGATYKQLKQLGASEIILKSSVSPAQLVKLVRSYAPENIG